MERETKPDTLLECGHVPTPQDTGSCTTGYGTDKDGNRACFACCGENDRKAMLETGKATLYLTGIDTYGLKGSGYLQVANWPGTLVFNVGSSRTSRNNWGSLRTDVWFCGPDGKTWYGRHIGSSHQLISVRRLKH